MDAIQQQPVPTKRVRYPDSDGQPMAENTKQFQWIVTVEGGVDAMYRDDPNVFVAGDLLWYPVEGDNKTRQAPDTMVAFGRPKGYRGSYMQWKEAGIAPQVVFEILSPGNRTGEMGKKFDFYERYGVQEYYVYDPDRPRLEVYLRRGDKLEEVLETDGFVSPLLKIRFDMSGDELVIFRPDGKRFQTFVELAAESDNYAARVAEMERRSEEDLQARLQAQQRADQAQQRAEQEKLRAEQENVRAELEKQRAELEKQRAELEKQRAELAEAKAARLAERLRQLGFDNSG